MEAEDESSCRGAVSGSLSSGLDLSSISMRWAGVGTVHFDVSFWLMLPIAAMVAAFFGLLFGVPALRLKGDADQAALRQFSR